MDGDNHINVLVVEDNPGDARLVQEMLREASALNLCLHYASSMREAQQRLAGEAFDVALVDLCLPDAEGEAAVKRLQHISPRLPIVVLSCLKDEDLALRLLQGGAQDFLVKGQGDGNLIKRALRYAIERKRRKEMLSYLAQHDQLTGLPNRSLFLDRLNQSVAYANRGNREMAVLFMDLDRFKSVNDVLGHGAGDQLLKLVAERVSHTVRKEDTVARIGGDEFTVILAEMAHGKDAALVADKILRALAAPVSIEGMEIFPSASVGIAVFPHAGDTPDALLKHADAAMYRAKEQGGGCFAFYRRDGNDKANERLSMEGSLRRALEREEFELHYQPIADVKTRAVVGVEALLRWRHPDKGLLEPKDFMDLLEETGLIVPVGEWVLTRASMQSWQWLNEVPRPIPVAMNLSARELRQEGFVAMVQRVIGSTHADPRLLSFELTEGMLMENTAACQQTLNVLREQGISVSVDDFGTGYSSLAYLKRFPLTSLKIDRSFVRDIPASSDDCAIVTAIIGLAHNLRMTVIAEGVEAPAQLEFLVAHGCDAVQGFMIGRPVAASEIPSLVSAQSAFSAD